VKCIGHVLGHQNTCQYLLPSQPPQCSGSKVVIRQTKIRQGACRTGPWRKRLPWTTCLEFVPIMAFCHSHWSPKDGAIYFCGQTSTHRNVKSVQAGTTDGCCTGECAPLAPGCLDTIRGFKNRCCSCLALPTGLRYLSPRPVEPAGRGTKTCKLVRVAS
jgi:hypothetical protein